MVKEKFNSREVKNIVDRFAKGLEQNKIKISKIILFGSYAQGNPRQYSDIDLAVISPVFNNKGRFKIQSIIAKATPRDQEVLVAIEPIGYSTKEYENTESGSFLGEIKKTGKIVYSR